jgi:hypothetical protein
MVRELSIPVVIVPDEIDSWKINPIEKLVDVL